MFGSSNTFYPSTQVGQIERLNRLYTASSLPFSSNLVRAIHARESGEAARRAKRGRAISHARGHLRVSRFARRTTEKMETARSLKRLRHKR